MGCMDLDSSLLRAFVAVAEQLHFGQAARGLFISQQALSKRIARLESMLGIRLLERDRRSVALTAAGQRLLPEARAAVDAIDAAAAVARTGPASLTVDVLDEHLAMLPAVRAINESDPGLQLSAVMRHDASDAVTMLRRGQADIGLGRPGGVQTPWPRDIQGRTVLAEPIRLLVPEGHELDRAESITIADLARYPLWFPTAGAPTEWIDLLSELISTFDLTVDQAGSTFGFDYWVQQVARGSARPSFIGQAMKLPPSLPVSSVAIVDPTPVFCWWALWRRRLPTDLVIQFLCALGHALAGGQEHARSTDLWMPQRDTQFTQGGQNLSP